MDKDKATKIHIFLSGALAIVTILALHFRWSGLISGVAVLLVNIYLIAILYEVFHRSGAERKILNGVLLDKPVYLFPFPSKAWIGLLIIFIVCAAVSGFANMYIYSAEIAYVGPVIEVSNLGVETSIADPAPTILQSKIDALYFSLVTMITLGYGDFLPVSTVARALVMWQLATGGLLVIGVFPLIISRVASI